MNSVFSVFKSNSNGSSGSHSTNHNHNNSNGVSPNGHHHNGGGGSNSSSDPMSGKFAAKKITNDSSYENLRHIRELESCTKMTGFVDVTARGDDDGGIGNRDDADSAPNAGTIRLNGGQRCVTPVVVSRAVAELAQDEDLDDDVHEIDTVDCASVSAKPPLPVDYAGARGPPKCDATAPASKMCASASASPAPHAPIIVSHSRGHSESNLCATQKTTTRFQKRLSLSGFANNSMPSVHGRPASASAAATATNGCGPTAGMNGGGGEVKRTRLSTHQRNLSLDFR